jgi:hypothetical protein
MVGKVERKTRKSATDVSKRWFSPMPERRGLRFVQWDAIVWNQRGPRCDAETQTGSIASRNRESEKLRSLRQLWQAVRVVSTDNPSQTPRLARRPPVSPGIAHHDVPLLFSALLVDLWKNASCPDHRAADVPWNFECLQWTAMKRLTIPKFLGPTEVRNAGPTYREQSNKGRKVADGRIYHSMGNTMNQEYDFGRWTRGARLNALGLHFSFLTRP